MLGEKARGDVINFKKPEALLKLTDEILTIDPSFDSIVFSQGATLVKNPQTLTTIHESISYLNDCATRGARMQHQSILRILRRQISDVEVVLDALRSIGRASFTERARRYGEASGYDSKLGKTIVGYAEAAFVMPNPPSEVQCDAVHRALLDLEKAIDAYESTIGRVKRLIT